MPVRARVGFEELIVLRRHGGADDLKDSSTGITFYFEYLGAEGIS